MNTELPPLPRYRVIGVRPAVGRPTRKARASEKSGTLLPKEKASAAYNAALIKRYGHLPEIKRIARHRHLPKHIYSTTKLHREVKDKERRKAVNRMKHSAPGTSKIKPARQKKIVKTLE